MNLRVTIHRDDFNTACETFSQEDADRIVETFPDMFRPYLQFAAAPAEPAPKPGPVKARLARADVESWFLNKEALATRLVDYVAHNPNKRGEEIATFVYNSVESADRGDFKAFSRIARDILEKFVTDGKMYADGERRGRRYKIAAPKQEEGAAE